MTTTYNPFARRRSARGLDLSGSETRLSPNGSAVWMRIPRKFARPCGGCRCPFCTANPDRTPRWDTLAIPLDDLRHPPGQPIPGGAYPHAWTIHAPEFWTA